ncbi:MAG: VWA domain-containing protein [Thermoplasmata archaeon]
MDRPGRFADRVAGFFPFLRTRGIAVGLGEELDLAKALEHVDPLQRGEFHLASRTTLVKRHADIPAFDAAFEAYWSSAAGSEPPAPPPSYPRLPVTLPPDNVGEAWGTTAYRLGEEQRTRADQLRLLIYSPNAPPGQRKAELISRSQLSSVRRVARRFRRWAATVEGRRRVPRRKGDIDFPRTIRGSLRSGAELLAVRRQGRKLQRTRLVILWDVSGSMEGHGPLLLAIVYGLLGASPSTRLFAFSTELQPLTSELRGRSYRDAARLVQEKLQRAGGGTQIGRCLADFQRDHGLTLDRRTVLLILSDGWDVGRLDLLERQMASLARRAALLLWVNPYAERDEFHPDVAGMRRALPYIDLLVPPSAFVEMKAFSQWFGPSRSSAPVRGRRVLRPGATPQIYAPGGS